MTESMKIIKNFSRWFNTNITCVMDKTGKKGFGTSLHFELPDSVVQELLKGAELGDVMDRIAKKKNIKENLNNESETKRQPKAVSLRLSLHSSKSIEKIQTNEGTMKIKHNEGAIGFFTDEGTKTCVNEAVQ